MSRYVRVATVHDVKPGTCRAVEVQGRWIALFNVEGKIYATEDTCPHAGGPLGEGRLTGEIVTCPWHGWRYNVRTGERPENPDFVIAHFEVKIVGEEIQVAIPEE